MSNIWEKFDSKIDTEGLKKDVAEAAEGNSDFKEVPLGQYEVTIDKMELKESKKGSPMVSIWFKILEGSFKNSIIFYNQVIVAGFGLHMANEMLRSLDSGVDIEFENYHQYNDLLISVFEGVSGLEYAIRYGENDKGYNTHEITDVFDANDDDSEITDEDVPF